MAYDGGTQSPSILFSAVIYMVQDDSSPPCAHSSSKGEEQDTPPPSKRTVWMFPTSLPIGPETAMWPHLSARDTGKRNCFFWIAMHLAKNCISLGAGERQSEGIGGDGSQIFGSLLEVSHPMLINQLPFLFFLYPQHFFSCAPHSTLTSSLSHPLPPGLHGPTQNSLLVLLFSYSLLHTS